MDSFDNSNSTIELSSPVELGSLNIGEESNVSWIGNLGQRIIQSASLSIAGDEVCYYFNCHHCNTEYCERQDNFCINGVNEQFCILLQKEKGMCRSCCVEEYVSAMKQTLSLCIADSTISFPKDMKELLCKYIENCIKNSLVKEVSWMQIWRELTSDGRVH